MLGIIVNPKSGNSVNSKQCSELICMLENRHLQFVYKETQYANHAIELARQFVETGCQEILVLGGDGTLSEVIDGIMHAQVADELRKTISVGLVPRGTGNDWGRYWGLTHKYGRSLDIFFNSGKKQPIDIGCLTLYRNQVEEKHYFVNSIGFGLDAKTIQRANTMKYYVGSHGLNYFFGLLSAVFTHRSTHLNIITDDGMQISEQMFTMNIGNGPFSGGGIRQNPDANPCDGIFHGMFVGNPTFRLIMSALPRLFNGHLTDISFIKKITAKWLTIETDDYLPFEKDGILVEALGPYKIEIIPSALQMVVPIG